MSMRDIPDDVGECDADVPSTLRLRWPQEPVAPYSCHFIFTDAQLRNDTRLQALYLAIRDLNVIWEVLYRYNGARLSRMLALDD